MGKLIDADKLLDKARVGGNVTTYSELVEWIEKGLLAPDPIPLPTIKPGDKVRHKEYPASKGIVEEVFISAQVNFDDARTDYRLIDLEVISDEKV